MIIEFTFLNLEDSSFKRVYFEEWNDRTPLFTANKRKANYYINEDHAQEDVALLNKARSDAARTLNIRVIRR